MLRFRQLDVLLHRAAFLLAGLLVLPLLASAQTVLLLSTGDSALDLQTRNVLQGAGYSVTVGNAYTSLAPAELTGINVVLLLPNHNWNTGDMPLASQAALVSFVQNGGGLVTSEWTDWKVSQGDFATLSPILPATSASQYGNISGLFYVQATADSALNAGLGNHFVFSTDNYSGVESKLTAKAGATVFYTTLSGAGGAGVVGWANGSGRVMQFSTTAGPNELANADYARLFVNSVAWTAQGVPEPSTCACLVLGLAFVGWRVARRRA